MIDQMQVDVWKKCYGLSHTLPSSIQLQLVDPYFQYIFGKGWFLMLLQCSSHNYWVFLDNVWRLPWSWPQTSKGIGWIFWLGYINDYLVLIHKGCFCSSLEWSKVAKAIIPLEYDRKNNNKHVSIKQKLRNMVETWQKIFLKCVPKLQE